MNRAPKNKRLALTPRDTAIFSALHRYRYLRSTYLHAFAGGASQTRFRERLGDLFHEGYLDRPAKQWEFANARNAPAVYELGSGARGILIDRPAEPGTFLSGKMHCQFHHSVAICETLASIELAALKTSSIRLISWPEILARAPQATQCARLPFRISAADGSAVIPDGVFGFEYDTEGRKSYRFFALEVDRGTMPITRADRSQASYISKLTCYAKIVAEVGHRKQLGVPNLLVLTLTSSEARLQAILAAADRAFGEMPHFLFKVLPDLRNPAQAILQEPWMRQASPALRIDVT